MWRAALVPEHVGASEDDDVEDEPSRVTWPTSPPPDPIEAGDAIDDEAPWSTSRDAWADCTTLAERIVRLVGRDGGCVVSGRAVSVDHAIDRALAENPQIERVLRRRSTLARAQLDADRLKELFAALVHDVLEATPKVGPYARGVAVHTEIDGRGRVVVEVTDLRRLWTAGGDVPDDRSHVDDAHAWLAHEERNARASDAATGIVLCTTTHPSFGRLARVEIPHPKG